MATNTAGTTARQTHLQVVHTLRKNLTFASTGLTVDIGQLPAYASVIGGGIHVTAGDATETVDVGFRAGNSTDDPNGYATLLDVANVGYIALDELAATTNIQQTEDCIVTATLTAGMDTFVGDLIILYVVDNDG